MHDLKSLARRRRHATLIATLTDLVGQCAAAAGAVYRPIAEAPPEQMDVIVSLRPIIELSSESVGMQLDEARAEDSARWPSIDTAEKEADERTFVARCAASEAESVLARLEEACVGSPGPIPPPTAPQSAFQALVCVGMDFLAVLLEDPQRAIDQARKAAATGEFTVDQILDEATDTVILAGLLDLHGAGNECDPSKAAEACLAASRHFTLAVTLASADVEEDAG